ncbi:MAG TPA: hypothetical protein VLH84_06190 [Patescibacteria group bacterium]|nr:hypothetical protein [Patescibacteria group bacterium]
MALGESPALGSGPANLGPDGPDMAAVPGMSPGAGPGPAEAAAPSTPAGEVYEGDLLEPGEGPQDLPRARVVDPVWAAGDTSVPYGDLKVGSPPEAADAPPAGPSPSAGAYFNLDDFLTAWRATATGSPMPGAATGGAATPRAETTRAASADPVDPVMAGSVGGGTGRTGSAQTTRTTITPDFGEGSGAAAEAPVEAPPAAGPVEAETTPDDLWAGTEGAEPPDDGDEPPEHPDPEPDPPEDPPTVEIIPEVWQPGEREANEIRDWALRTIAGNNGNATSAFLIEKAKVRGWEMDEQTAWELVRSLLDVPLTVMTTVVDTDGKPIAVPVDVPMFQEHELVRVIGGVPVHMSEVGYDDPRREAFALHGAGGSNMAFGVRLSQHAQQLMFRPEFASATGAAIRSTHPDSGLVHLLWQHRMITVDGREGPVPRITDRGLYEASVTRLFPRLMDVAKLALTRSYDVNNGRAWRIRKDQRVAGGAVEEALAQFNLFERATLARMMSEAGAKAHATRVATGHPHEIRTMETDALDLTRDLVSRAAPYVGIGVGRAQSNYGEGALATTAMQLALQNLLDRSGQYRQTEITAADVRSTPPGDYPTLPRLYEVAMEARTTSEHARAGAQRAARIGGVVLRSGAGTVPVARFAGRQVRTGARAAAPHIRESYEAGRQAFGQELPLELRLVSNAAQRAVLAVRAARSRGTAAALRAERGALRTEQAALIGRLNILRGLVGARRRP